MSIIGRSVPFLNTSKGYNISKSLRLRRTASAYLSRTPSSTSNLRTWTWSAWLKLGTMGVYQELFGCSSSGPTINHHIYMYADGRVGFEWYNVTFDYAAISTAYMRDPSAWYHVVVIWDTPAAAASDRMKIYINGVYTSGASTVTQNLDGQVNSTAYPINIGKVPLATNYYDGLMAEMNFVDGQALTPSSFGETNPATGVWRPKKYIGTYGTNGFYLPFSDNSALTTSSNIGLGKDFSGNSNYWVTNAVSITTDATYDSFTDVPTLTSATASNFAVLNPLDKGANITLSDSNLTSVNTATAAIARSTIGVSSGKWYWELTVESLYGHAGIVNATESLSTYIGSDANGWAYNSSNGLLYTGGATSGTNATWMTVGDVIGFAFDASAGTLSFYKNGALQPSSFSGIPAGTYHAAIGTSAVGTNHFNFGQRPFAYNAPTGFLCLNTFNLPDSTIKAGNKYFDATAFVANAGIQTIVNNGSMAPDLVWTKSRGSAYQHLLYNTVRGVNTYLISNTTSAEATTANTLTAFNSNGFTLGVNDSANYNNGSAAIAWQWKKGATPGFDIVTYTGNGTSITVNHSLGIAPAFMIIKSYNQVLDWGVFHKSLGAGSKVYLDLTSASSVDTTFLANTLPTSASFTCGANSYSNNSAAYSYIAYLWAEIAGFSKFDSYVGNGSADGPFVYCGFRPKFLLIKDTTAANQWVMWDSTRDPVNVINNELGANSAAAEGAGPADLDFVSNGFKIRRAATNFNTSTNTIIYAAFAENPFKDALAR